MLAYLYATPGSPGDQGGRGENGSPAHSQPRPRCSVRYDNNNRRTSEETSAKNIRRTSEETSKKEH